MVGRHRTTDPSSGQHRFSGRARRRLPATLLAHSKLTACAVVMLLAASVTSIVLTQSTAPVAAAQAACTPDAGYTQCARFTNSDADQSFPVPAGADPTNILVKAWGAGAGANSAPGSTGGFSSGGSGGYVSGVVSTTSGTTFAVMVGGGSAYDGQPPSNAYGFGGSGGPLVKGSGGGGLSGVFLGSAPITATSTARAVLVAGGGGGGGGNLCSGCFSLGGQGGGSFSGGQPTMQGQDDSYATTSTEGGGGGGGYAGGNANQTRLTGSNTTTNGSLTGEGGSNYIGGVTGATVTGGVSSASPEYTTAIIVANDGSKPPNSTDAQYVAGVGVGKTLIYGNGAAVGGDGLVVFEYNLLPTVTIKKISTGGVGTFNYTGTNGFPATPVTTAVAGTAVSSTAKILSTPSTATTITEAATAGFTLAASATPCTGMGSGGTATLNAATGALTLDSAATADNAVIVCTFTNALTTDLSITKTDNVTNVAGSQARVYTVVITNNGPNTATSALLKDALPTGLASFSSITCAVASGTATCPTTMTQALITGAGITIPSMSANSSLRFSISGTTAATLLANIVNTASVTPSAVMVNSGTSCVSPAIFTSATGVCAATDTDVPVQPDLSITKTDSSGTYLLGIPVTYTIVVANSATATATATNAVFKDAAVAGLTANSVTCTVTAGTATCPTAPTVAQIQAGVAIPSIAAGGSVTFKVVATPTTNTTTLTNAATTAPSATQLNLGTACTAAGGSYTAGTGVCTATDADTPLASVSLTKNLAIRVNAADQFTIGITAGAASASATTTGAGTGVQAATSLAATAGTTYTLTEAMAAGSVSTLGSYVISIACTDTTTSTPVTVTGTGPSWSLLVPNTDSYACTITNQRPPLSCVNTIFGLTSGATALLYAFNATTGAQTTIGTPANAGVVNSLGASSDGSTLYYLDGGSFIKYTVATGTTSTVATFGVNPAGAINPVDGNFYVSAGGTGATLTQINVTTGAVTSVGTFGTMSGSSGDLTFDNAGNGYFLSGSGGGLYQFTVPSTPGTIPMKLISTISTGAGGIAFGSDGYLYASFSSGQFFKYDPFTGAQIGSGIVISPAVGAQDMASCAYPPNLTVQKVLPNGRFVSTDQFTLSATENGNATAQTVTTTGTGTTATGIIGPTPVIPGLTYTIGETASSGALTNYTSSYSCVDTANGNTSIASGSTTGGSLVVPTATTNRPNIVCTLTNSALTTDLSITKTDNVSSFVPGQALVYTVVVANSSAATIAATNSLFKDPAVTGLTVSTVTCGSVTGSASCPIVANTTKALMQGAGIVIPSIPAGGSVTFTVTAAAAAGTAATANIVNTATATTASQPSLGNACTAAGGSFGGAPPVCTAVDTDTPLPADLSITKTDNVTAYIAGQILTYTVAVSNAAGSGPAGGSVVKDTLPSGVTFVAAVTCSATGSAVCPAVNSTTIASGVTVATFPAGGTLTFVLTGTVNAVTSGPVVNSVTVTPPSGLTSLGTSCAAAGSVFASNVCTATDTDAGTSVDLSVTKTDNVTTYVPGQINTYTIVVRNAAGASTALNTVVKDPLPTAVTFAASVTCTATGGAVCPAVTGTTIASGVTVTSIPAGGSVTFVVTATVGAAATGTLTNNVTATLPAGATNSGAACTSAGSSPSGNVCTATDVDAPRNPDVAVTKTDTVSAYVPNQVLTYTIVVSNAAGAGVGPAPGTVFQDPLPTGLTYNSVTCVAAGSAVCPTITTTTLASGVTIATLPAGGTLTFTVTATVGASATGNLVNSATATLASGYTNAGTTCTSSGSSSTATSCTATDTDTAGTVDLNVTKTDNVTTYIPGATPTYTIVVSNGTGASVAAAQNTIFTDPAISQYTVSTVTCASPTGGAVCPTAGNTTKALMQGAGIVIPSLPAGSSVTFTVKGTVPTTVAGNMVNLATITPASSVTSSGASCTATSGNTFGSNACSDSDTDTPVPPTVQISKISSTGTGTFAFTGNNGYSGDSITTTTAGTAKVGTVRTLSNASTVTTISETIPTGWAVSNVTCTGMGPGGTSTVNLPAGTVTLDALATSPAAAIACTFTDRQVAVITCTSNTALFNTGYNSATGGILANATVDPRWQVSPVIAATTPSDLAVYPPADTPFGAAYVGNISGGAWINSPFGNANWVDREYGPSGTADWYYQMQFTMDATINPALFSLQMDFYADNSVYEVWVNGVPQSGLTTGLPMDLVNPYQYGGFQTGKGALTTLNHSWQTGLNTILVQIKSGAGYEGFMAQMEQQPPTSCPAPPTVQLAKTTANAVPAATNQFGFATTGLDQAATENISVVGNTTTTSTITHNGVAGQAATLTESTAPLGWPTDPTSVSCLDTTAPGDRNATTNLAVQSGSVWTLPASVMVAGAVITCTFTDTFPPPTMNVTKVFGTSRIAATDQVTVGIYAGNISGAIQNATTNSTTTGTGSTVTAGTGTTGVTTLAANTTYVVSEAASGTTSFSNYASSLTCTDSSGYETSPLPANQTFNPVAGWPITVQGGAIIACTITNNAQAYITIQKQSLSEDVNQPFNFTVTPTGGSTSSFTLNDQANNTNVTANSIPNPKDIGVSFDSTRSTLYATAGNAATDGCGGVAADGCIYYRSPGTSTWVKVPGVSGLNIHGAATANTFFYVTTAGGAFYYNGTTAVSLGSPPSGCTQFVDIADNGATGAAEFTDATCSNNVHAVYTGNYAGTNSWVYQNVGGQRVDLANDPNHRMPMISSTVDYSCTYNAVAHSIPACGDTGYRYANDVATNPDASIFYYSDGTSIVGWNTSSGAATVFTSAVRPTRITAGTGGRVWAIEQQLTTAGVPTGQTFIAALMTDGTAAGQFYDAENISTGNSNSIQIAVTPGAYNVAETAVAGWSTNAVTCVKPTTSTATGSISPTANAAITIAAGDNVTCTFQNFDATPTITPVTTSCSTPFVDTFGTGSTGTLGSALTGLTSYHYNGTVGNNTGDDFYAVTGSALTASNSWTAFTDHTAGNGLGRFEAVNGGPANGVAYQRRFAGLTVGTSYSFGLWAAALTASNPNLSIQIYDATTHALLATLSSGNLTLTTWKQFQQSFVATSTSVDLMVSAAAPGITGPDFGIDDVSFGVSCVPVTVTKALGGARSPSTDQFTVSITDAATSTVQNVTTNSTTLGAAAAVTAGSGTTGATQLLAGSAYNLLEAGSTATSPVTNLAYYSSTITCTDANSIQTGLPSAAAYNQATGFALTPVAGANISCVITNTPKPPQLTVVKALGSPRALAGDQFISQIHLTTAAGTVQNVTTNSTTTGTGSTVTAGTGTTGVTNLTAGSTYFTNEALSGTTVFTNYVTTETCIDANGVQTGLPTNQTITATTGVSIVPVAHASITCTITNTAIPAMTVVKALGGARNASTDQFVVAIRAGTVGGTVTNVTTNSTTAGTGSTVTAGTGTTGRTLLTAGSPFVVTEAAAGTTSLGQYNSVLTCTDANGVQAGLPTSQVFLPSVGVSITPVAGAALACTISNTVAQPTITLTKTTAGSLSNPTTFSFGLTGVTNATDSIPVTGATSVTSSTTHTGTAGTASVITETPIPAGWQTTPTSITCVDSNATGSGNASGTLATGSGAAVTVAGTLMKLGAKIVCTFTDAPLAPTVKVVKTTVNGSGTNTFSFTFTGGATGTESLAVPSPGTVTSAVIHTATAGAALNIAESFLPAGWPATAIVVSCIDSNAAFDGNIATNLSTQVTSVALPASVMVNAAAITCTFSNAFHPPQIAIAKTTSNGTGSNTFGFTFGGGLPGSDSLSVTGAGTTTGAFHLAFPAQAATATGSSVPVGWPANPVSVTCLDSAAPGDGNPTANLSTLATSVAIPAANMVADALITCTFVNSLPLPTVTVAKTTTGSLAAPTTFSFALSGVTTSADTIPVAGVTSVTSSTTHLGTGGTPATITETPIPVGWQSAPSAISCTDTSAAASGNPAGVLVTGTGAAVTLTGAMMRTGATILCTFTDAPLAPSVTLAKTTTNGSGVNVFGFTLGGSLSGSESLSVTGAATVIGSAHTATVGQAISATESSVPSGWPATPVSVSCIDANASVDGNIATNLSTSPTAVALAASVVVNGAAITCTFIDTATALLSTTKTLSLINGVAPTPGQSVHAGDVLVYTITTSNSGAIAGSTVLTETAPTGTSYVGVSEGWTGSGPYTQTVTVGAGAPPTVVAFTVKVATPVPPGQTTIVNTLTSSASTCACAVTTPLQAQISVSKTVAGRVDPADEFTVSVADLSATVLASATTTGGASASSAVVPVALGTYAVAVTNTGGAAGQTTLGDIVPANTTYVGSATDGLWTFVGNSGTQTVEVDSGKTTIVTFTVKVNATLPAGTSFFENKVTTTTGTCSKCIVDNNPGPVLTTTKTAYTINNVTYTAASVLHPGDTVVYLFSTVNTGGTTGAVTIGDPVPAQTTYTGHNEGWSCTAGAAAGTPCTQSVSVDPGQTVQKFFTITTLTTLTGNLKNVATVTGPPGTVCTNNCSVNIPGGNLNTAKTLFQVNGVTATADQVVKAGDILVYQTTVTNSGDGSGSTVVTETIPTNTTYTGQNEGWTFINTTQATQTVNVGAGASVPVKFTVTVADPPAFNTRAIVNNVTTSNGTCNPCSVSHPTPTPGVTLTKTASVSTVGAVGDVVTYTYTAKNTGQTDLDSIDIAEITFSGKGTAPDVSACADEIGALAVGESGTCTATYVLTSADIASKANIVNTATATGTPPNDPPVTSPPASYTLTVKPPVVLAFTGAPQVEQELILVGLFIAFGGLLLLTSRAYRRRRNAA